MAWALLVPGAIACAVWVAFGDAITENFRRPEWEDARFFHYTAAHVHSLADAFALGSYWSGLYRPLSTNLYYWLGRLAWHNDLRVYHSINLAIYIVNGLLAYHVCRSFLSRGLSLLVALLFCTRSASVEVLLYTCQMQTLLPAFFSLLALDAYLRAGDAGRGGAALLIVAAVAATLLALLSKEAAVSLPFVLLVFWLARRERGAGDTRRQLAGALGALGATGGWFAIAYRHLAITNNRYWHYVLRPLGVAGNYAAYAVASLNVLIDPVHLTHPVQLDRYPAIVAVHASLESRLLVIAAAIASLVVLALRQQGFRRPSDRAALAAASFLGFALIMAPYAVLEHRRLMYYGYFGYFPLALSLVATVEVAAVAIARRVLPLPRWKRVDGVVDG